MFSPTGPRAPSFGLPPFFRPGLPPVARPVDRRPGVTESPSRRVVRTTGRGTSRPSRSAPSWRAGSWPSTPPVGSFGFRFFGLKVEVPGPILCGARPLSVSFLAGLGFPCQKSTAEKKWVASLSFFWGFGFPYENRPKRRKWYPTILTSQIWRT